MSRRNPTEDLPDDERERPCRAWLALLAPLLLASAAPAQASIISCGEVLVQVARLDNRALVDAVFADFGHTVSLYMGPEQPGISAVSLGGHDYTMLVPEPGAFTLWAAGLAAVGGPVRVRSRARRGS